MKQTMDVIEKAAVAGITRKELVQNDKDYHKFLEHMKVDFQAIAEVGVSLFVTDAANLYEAFMAGIPEKFRQHYTCRACKEFVDKFGGLVWVDHDGYVRDAIWPHGPVPEFFAAAVSNVKAIVAGAEIGGVFYAEERTIGKPVTGDWQHMSVKLPKELVKNSLLKTAEQLMAEKREDYLTVRRALAEFNVSTLETAVAILESETLYRSEKCLGAAKWLRDLKLSLEATRSKKRRNNLLWLAIAKAPAGFCHPRASMIGTLLEDLIAELPLATVKRNFANKMDPLKYQRPQAAPKEGNIAEAEKLVVKLGIEQSLRRRFARLEEIEALWRPKDNVTRKKGGVFGHLRGDMDAGSSRVVIPNVTMTWEKFLRTVVPEALEIDYEVMWEANYTALLTAVDMGAPPILQWDKDDCRNPFSWYVWHGFSRAIQWGLSSGRWNKVNAISFQPNMWFGNENQEHNGKSVIFILDGAKETKFDGLALFPETLKSELHGIRSVIEAHSKKGVLEGQDEASACGVMFGSKSTNPYMKLRVKTKHAISLYTLDRWD